MTDAQLAIILSAAAAGGGAVIAFLRWAVNRITKSWDAATAALIDNSAKSAALSVRLETFTSELRTVGDRIDYLAEWAEEHSGVGPVPKPPRARTPAGGVSTRAPTHGEYGPHVKPRGGG